MSFTQKLQHWYAPVQRDLPWRKTRDPYTIWLSEVILQQTRVDQGLPYFLKFKEEFPNIQDLAMAPEDKVLQLWQGLGYYSRARNLHTAAKEVVEKFKGAFPSDYASIRSLKGVGDYTAAAVSSISFNLPHAVLDGNVFRVISRWAGIDTCILSNKGKKQFQTIAQELLDQQNPAGHNQAIMELGATICTPAKPKCGECPVSDGCFARIQGQQLKFPVKSKEVKIRERYLNYLFLFSSDSCLIKKREGKDIWKGLYEFPSIESNKLLDPDDPLIFDNIKNFFSGKPVFLDFETYKHKLTHQTLHARFFKINVQELKEVDDFQIKNFSELSEFGFPQLLAKFLSSETASQANLS